MEFSRRTFISRVSAVFGAFAFAHPLSGIARMLAAKDGNQLRFPPVLSQKILSATGKAVEIWQGSQTQLQTLNEVYPSPSIVVHKGDNFSVRLQNQLTESLVLHWHGILAPDNMDGHPKYQIASGQIFDYAFPIVQRASTCFYHSHTDMFTAKQVYMGIAGFFIVSDDEEQALNLPAGEFDVPLAIQDRRISATKQFVYSPSMQDSMQGYTGDTILVNGTPDAYLSAKQTLYRFRLLNGSNARIYKIAFSNNAKFYVIGSDGGLLPAPIETTWIHLAPGERVEILVDFSPYSLGSSLYLKTVAFTGVGGNVQGAEANILRIDIDESTTIKPKIPTKLVNFQQLSATDALRTRIWTIESSMMQHTINGKVFSMNRIDAVVPFGETEIWEFRSTSPLAHPMHAHGVHFQVLSRNGALLPNDYGWKDTVLVFPNETVRVILRFDAYPGLFLLHCHNLEHEDMGMMLNFTVEKTSDVGENLPVKQMRIAPNPADSHALLRFPALNREEMLEITDALGRVTERVPLSEGMSEILLDTKRKTTGEYWCKIGNESVKFMVTH